MVAAGQFAAALFNRAKHAANNGAQRFLDDFIIGDEAVGGFIAHSVCSGAVQRERGQGLRGPE